MELTHGAMRGRNTHRALRAHRRRLEVQRAMFTSVFDAILAEMDEFIAAECEPLEPAAGGGEQDKTEPSGAAAPLQPGINKKAAAELGLKPLDILSTIRSNEELRLFVAEAIRLDREERAAAPLQREPIGVVRSHRPGGRYAEWFKRFDEAPVGTLIYLAAGAQREPLSDEQIRGIADQFVHRIAGSSYDSVDFVGFARAVLAASPVDPSNALGDPIEAKASAVQRPAGVDEALREALREVLAAFDDTSKTIPRETIEQWRLLVQKP